MLGKIQSLSICSQTLPKASYRPIGMLKIKGVLWNVLGKKNEAKAVYK